MLFHMKINFIVVFTFFHAWALRYLHMKRFVSCHQLGLQTAIYCTITYVHMTYTVIFTVPSLTYI